MRGLIISTLRNEIECLRIAGEGCRKMQRSRLKEIEKKKSADRK
jgi:hypothetical protein